MEIEKKYDVLMLLSGPEPQRTIFENILTNELKTFEGTVLLVRGLPMAKPVSIVETQNKITVVDHLAANELNKAIQQSKIIVSRSGYTTIMDMVKLQQKAILVPTPGQTEQEYLATYLMDKKIFLNVLQNNFSLATAIQKANSFSSVNIILDQEVYIKIITEWVSRNL